MLIPRSLACGAFSLLAVASVAAQAPDIDRLLSKLPAPESIVKPRVDRRLLEARELQADPQAREMLKAVEGRDARRSLELARVFTERYPRNASAAFVRGTLAMINRQHAEADASLRRAATLDPKLVVVQHGLALNALSQRNFAAAIPPLKRAAELAPQDPGNLLGLAECSVRLGRKDEAALYARRATAVAPAAPGVWLALARAENLRRDYPAALRALGRAAELEPDNFMLQASLGFSYINLKRDAEAIAPLERAYRRNNKDVVVAGQLGYCYLKAGQLPRAEELLRHATRLNSAYGPAWAHLGNLQNRRSQPAEAAKSLRRATELMPRNAGAWRDYALALRATGRADEAAKAEARAQALPKTG